jgi:septal ring factor EnvC (AmiA/AmiB activator)
LAQLEELAQRLAELRARGVELSAQIEGLKSDRARIIAQMEAPGLSDAARAKLQAEGVALDAQIAALEAQQEQNAAKMAEAEQQLQGTGAARAGKLRRRTGEAAASARDLRRSADRGGPTGKTYKPEVAGLDMEFVGLSAGRFCMGSPEGVGYDDEHPQHPVKVSGFMLGKSEVTQAQWRAVVKAAQAANDVDAASAQPGPFVLQGGQAARGAGELVRRGALRQRALAARSARPGLRDHGRLHRALGRRRRRLSPAHRGRVGVRHAGGHDDGLRHGR